MSVIIAEHLFLRTLEILENKKLKSAIKIRELKKLWNSEKGLKNYRKMVSS